MKRNFVTILSMTVLFCLLFAASAIAAPGEARFGTGMTKDWKLVNESRTLDTNLITCAFFSPKAFGVMKVWVSIYQQENMGQTVLARAEIDVNPKWGALFLPDLPLPGVGKYTFTMSKENGDIMAEGSVAITSKKVEEKMPEKPKADGTTLEGLFNKFKPN